MQKVTGLGGVFFKANDAKALAAWYQRHLGIEFGDQLYFDFKWVNQNDPDAIGHTAFSIFKADSKYFHPGQKEFMLNFRVKDLRALLTELEKEGVEIVGEVEEFEYGKFGWIMDPEGNKIELWEPVNEK